VIQAKAMSVLCIASVWPEPKSTGAGQRMMELITLFQAQGWQLAVGCAAAETEFQTNLNELGISTYAIKVNDASFDELIKQLQPDIVLFDRFTMEEQFAWRVEMHCPHALRILETIDLHCLREARHQQAKRTQQVALNVQLADLYSEIAKREIAAIYRSDMSLLISDVEIDLLKRDFGMGMNLLHHCPFMLKALDEPLPSFEQRQHFISIGNFRHAPNWDSVLWMKQIIWPLIRKQLPTAQLHIYGSYTPPKATALNAPREGFHVLGRADDALAVMRQSRVCLAPLRFGAGIKTKLSDAMQTGTPSITTSVGAEGMSGGLAWGGGVADDVEVMVKEAVTLYSDEAAWQQAQQRGFKILSDWFDGRKHGLALIARITALMGNLEEHRLYNFTGAMLRHHHHRSTEFMSRWIEGKNKTAH